MKHKITDWVYLKESSKGGLGVYTIEKNHPPQGLYKIYIDDDLIDTGMTAGNILKRWRSHVGKITGFGLRDGRGHNENNPVQDTDRWLKLREELGTQHDQKLAKDIIDRVYVEIIPLPNLTREEILEQETIAIQTGIALNPANNRCNKESKYYGV